MGGRSWTVGWVHELGPAGIVHLVYFGVLVPFLVVRAAVRAKGVAPAVSDRVRHFRRTAFVLLMLGAVSLATALALDVELLPARPPPPSAVPAALGLYALAVAFMRPRWRRAVRERPERVQCFLAVTPAERGWWLAVAVLAGVGEELTWRGMQPILLANLLGSQAGAVLASALLFGVAHAMQGWRSAALIVLLALGFHLLVLLTGSLYAAMAVHTAYDVTAGWTMGRFAREHAAQVAAGSAGP